MRMFVLLMLAGQIVIAKVPQFREVQVSDSLKFGYQVVVADLNNDKRPDLIVVEERGTELAWYENPSWERHVLIQDVARVINLECQDLDGDGIPEIAMAYMFETQVARSKGIVVLLKAGADPRQPWTSKEIDRVPTTHRIRWAKTASGPLLLVSPFAGPDVNPPTYAGKTPLYAYKPGEWKRQTLYDSFEGVVHSIHPMSWQGSKVDHILVASFDGLTRLQPEKNGTWSLHPIAKGDTAACPKCGTGEVKPGKLGKRRFLATIEPYHGNQLVVYTEDGGKWSRHVLTDVMDNGHALAVGDLDGDGRDEIVAGFRGKGRWISVFSADDGRGTKWSQTIIDQSVAAADCKIADFNGDGRLDFVCSGGSTNNLKIYVNAEDDDAGRGNSAARRR